MAKPVKKKPDQLTRGDVESFTLGPTAAAIRQRAKPGQGQKLVAAAKQRGQTIDSFLDQSVPDALKQRTQGGIQHQAAATMRTAYAPAFAEVNAEDARVRAIDEKRSKDNQYYNDWLNARSREMAVSSQAADDRLRDMQAQIAQDSLAATGQLRQEMMQSGAQLNTVSNPEQATVYDPSAQMQANASLLGAARQQTADVMGASHDHQAAFDASNFAQVAALEARRSSDTWRSLSELGDDRQKLTLGKAADTAQEVSRLLDKEIEKANSNRDFAAIAERLGVQMAGVNQRERDSRRDAVLAAQKLAEDKRATRVREHIQNRLANIQQQNADTNLTTAQIRHEQNQISNSFRETELRIKEGKLDLDWWKAKHPNRGSQKDGGGQPAPDSPKPQDRFEWGYAMIATSQFQGKPRKDGTYPNKRYTPQYVARNRNLIEQKLVAKGLKPRMAKAAVTAFIVKGGTDPGSHRDYVDTPRRNHGPHDSQQG